MCYYGRTSLGTYVWSNYMLHWTDGRYYTRSDNFWCWSLLWRCQTFGHLIILNVLALANPVVIDNWLVFAIHLAYLPLLKLLKHSLQLSSTKGLCILIRQFKASLLVRQIKVIIYLYLSYECLSRKPLNLSHWYSSELCFDEENLYAHTP